MVHRPEITTDFRTTFKAQGNALAIRDLDEKGYFVPSEFYAAVRSAEVIAFNQASKHCTDLKQWYKAAGGKLALPETHAGYAAATLNGRRDN